MRFLYDLIFLLFAFLYFPYLLVKKKGHRDFVQKFGFLPDDAIGLDRPVWIHAVSVGEAALAARLAREIKKVFADVPVVVSTTTETGNSMIRKAGKGSVDAVFYYPLDLRAVVSRVVKLLGPSLYVMVETELWPNLLEELHLKGVPVVLANGRISDSSFANYSKIRGIMKRILGCVELFCMQSEKDAGRIKELGAPAEKVFITGNMKFDQAEELSDRKGLSREYLGFSGEDTILVAGSTHFPEESQVMDAFKHLKERFGNVKLILAPRHIERTDAVKVYIEKEGMSYRRFSDILSGVGQKGVKQDVLLVDTIGHLKDIYSVANLIFIGGSLARKGGQNPIEGAGWGKAVVFGPHMFNFREVADVFLENNAALRVKDAGQMKRAMVELLEDDTRRDLMGENARRVIDDNSGALKSTVEKLTEVLGNVFV